MQLQQTNVCDFQTSGSVWAIGECDKYKVMGIWYAIANLAQEPSEVIILDTDIYSAEIYDSFDTEGSVPIASDLLTVTDTLKQLLGEMRDRQTRLKCYGETRHRIVCAVEIDNLENSLKQRASELNVPYNDRELRGVLDMLREEGASVEIYLIASTARKEIVEAGDRLYFGSEALRFAIASKNYDGAACEEIITKEHPCCLAVAGDIYPIALQPNAVASIVQVEERERAIDLTQQQAPTKTGFFQRIRNLRGRK